MAAIAEMWLWAFGAAALRLWPLSFVTGRVIPERGKRILLMLLAFVSIERLVQLVRSGGEPLIASAYAVLAAAFIAVAWRSSRRRLPRLRARRQ